MLGTFQWVASRMPGPELDSLVALPPKRSCPCSVLITNLAAQTLDLPSRSLVIHAALLGRL